MSRNFWFAVRHPIIYIKWLRQLNGVPYFVDKEGDHIYHAATPKECGQYIHDLRAALLEAMRISRGMESAEGVDDRRVKEWRRTAHDLLQPNDRATANPQGEQK